MIKDTKTVELGLESCFEKIYYSSNGKPSKKESSELLVIKSEKDKQMLEQKLTGLKLLARTIQDSCNQLSSSFYGSISKHDFDITYTELLLYKMYSMYSNDLLSFSQKYEFDTTEFPSVFQLYQQITFLSKEVAKMANLEEGVDLKLVEKKLKELLNLGKIFYPFIVEHLKRIEALVIQHISDVTPLDTVCILVFLYYPLLFLIQSKKKLKDFVSDYKKHSTSAESTISVINTHWKQLKELKLADAFHYINFGEVLSNTLQNYCKVVQERVSKSLEKPLESKKDNSNQMNQNLMHSRLVSKELCVSVNNIVYSVDSCRKLEKEVMEAMKTAENMNTIILMSWEQSLRPCYQFLSNSVDEFLNSLSTSTREVLPLFIASDLQTDFQITFSQKKANQDGFFKDVNLKEDEEGDMSISTSFEIKEYSSVNETRTYFDEHFANVKKYLTQHSFEKYQEKIWSILCAVEISFSFLGNYSF